METDRASNDGSSLQRPRALHGRTSGPARRSTKGQWTAEEDEILRMAVHRFKGKNWKKIAECFRDRTDVQCLHRWQKVLNPELVKGPWTKEEDEKIIELVNKFGPKKWSTIAQHLPGRIGKQCRERWHNHLNPNINKEAWTQEEELTLIRAHQVYGNKWAELTKFLPGRTDNSIKNHWNSAVKKKLDMYMASGLLSQFQDLPLVVRPHHLEASSSSKAKQSSEDGSVVKVGAEVEEASECSQGSMSRTTSNNISLDNSRAAIEEASLVPYPEDYQPVFQEAAFMGSNLPIDDNLCLDWGVFEEKDWQQNPQKLPNVPMLELQQESSGLFWAPQNNCEAAVSFPQEPCIASGDIIASMDNSNMVYDEAVHGECCPSEIDIINMTCHGSTFQIPEDGTSTLQSCLIPSEVPIATQLSTASDGSLLSSSCKDSSICYSNKNAELESNPPSMHEDFIEPKESDGSAYEGGDCAAMDSRKLVPANDLISARSGESQCCSLVGKGEDSKTNEPKDSGVLCYEPPRFPSLDVPFFSCDLMQSDMQQEYSPLGIRQLMLSSLTPFKMWDSPSRDNCSPEAVLKSAAKTFTGTPSILRKRHRDLVSPLSEQRGEKKLGSCAFSNLANDFSRLEVMFNECADKPLLPPSPNQRHFEVSCTVKQGATSPGINTENQGKDHAIISENAMAARKANGSHCSTEIAEETQVQDAKINSEGNSVETGIEISGILVEHDLNDLLFFSPDRHGVRTDKAFVSKHGITLPSSDSRFSVVCSPRLTASKDGTNLVITTSLQTSTTPANKKAECSGKGVAFENNSMRSLESPSAWKSPWFLDGFVPGPRVDTDITVEDIGYFLSPGDCSYDAIGLMKQLGEQTARTFADAHEVLGNETPETLMKAKYSKAEKENQEHRLVSSSNAMRERRTLDFSECGTPPRPEKGSKKPSSSSASFSSPSSYLLKGCR
ncbi:transcription factor MYB3R-1-like isoform X2 [Andrographis paniculata]|uniref:transcription factor MYB3R-1-like isoform X2 n=1 Tax=Andrographis paniculata TaxID=175694 RepID=UPI0021E73890|nr:transcription factor MYB3R-1-like isoform X2 [Andrographis paniculata]